MSRAGWGGTHRRLPALHPTVVERAIAWAPGEPVAFLDFEHGQEQSLRIQKSPILHAVSLEEGELGASRRQRRSADHGTEPAFLGPSREDPDGGAEAKGQTGCHRSGFVDRRSIERLQISY
jgi:hypothetical protein